MWLCFGFVGGVVISRLYTFPSVSILLVLGLLSCLVWLFYKGRAWSVPGVVILSTVLGVGYGGEIARQYDEYASVIGARVTVKGVVKEDAFKRNDGMIQLTLGAVDVDGRRYVGEIWVLLRTSEIIKRSDQVALRGSLKPGFGSYSASMTYAHIVKREKRQDIARDGRDTFAVRVRESVDEPMASLGLGLLVGQRSELPEELDEQLRIAGLTHIIVASGYNVTILLRMAKRLFEKVSKYLTALVGGTLLVSFMYITGFTPSMTRAGLVGGLSLLAWYYGRSLHPLVLISIVMAITVWWNPAYVWGDIGWYLSFAAFFGVMVCAPMMQRYFFGESKPNFLRQLVGETLVALLMTAPVIMLMFQQYSTYAFISNLLIVPFVPIAMLITFCAGVIPFFGFIVNGVIGCMVKFVQIIAQIPNANGELQTSVLAVVMYYGSLFCALMYMWYKTKYNFRDDNLIE